MSSYMQIVCCLALFAVAVNAGIPCNKKKCMKIDSVRITYGFIITVCKASKSKPPTADEIDASNTCKREAQTTRKTSIDLIKVEIKVSKIRFLNVTSTCTAQLSACSAAKSAGSVGNARNFLNYNSSTTLTKVSASKFAKLQAVVVAFNTAITAYNTEITNNGLGFSSSTTELVVSVAVSSGVTIGNLCVTVVENAQSVSVIVIQIEYQVEIIAVQITSGSDTTAATTLSPVISTTVNSTNSTA